MIMKTSVLRFILFIIIALVITVMTSRISVKPNANPTRQPINDITIDYLNTNNTNDANDLDQIYVTNPNLRGSTGSSGALVESRIQKKSFSNRNRLLIVAGLEGTGHHALTTMFDVCINATTINSSSSSSSSSSMKGRCLPLPELTNALMFNNATARHGLFFSNDASKAGSYLRAIKQIMMKLNTDQQNTATLYILGCDHPTTSGMLSYPNFGNPQKSLNHPDVAVLARLAELAHIDFRIIVLQRSADNILISTQNRRFGGPKEGRTLSDNAASLYSQLKLLDSKFFHCIQYHELSILNDEKKKELIEFTHPLIQSILPKMLETIHSKNDITTAQDFIKIMNNRSNNNHNNDHNNNQNYYNMRKYITNNYDVHGIATRLQLIDNLCSKH